MQVVILCDQEIGVLGIKRFYYFLICFFHAHLIFHNSLYHGFPWFFHGLFFKLYDTMLSMLFPCFYKIRKYGISMEKQRNHGKTMISMLSSMLSLPGKSNSFRNDAFYFNLKASKDNSDVNSNFVE